MCIMCIICMISNIYKSCSEYNNLYKNIIQNIIIYIQYNEVYKLYSCSIISNYKFLIKIFIFFIIWPGGRNVKSSTRT